MGAVNNKKGRKGERQRKIIYEKREKGKARKKTEERKQRKVGNRTVGKKVR
jgi:hypothetical protein